jgi:hypothetical protein
MQITTQQDAYSCGLLAVNALARTLDPQQFNLIDAEAVDAERINILCRVINRHKEKVGSWVCGRLDITDQCSRPFVPSP